MMTPIRYPEPNRGQSRTIDKARVAARDNLQRAANAVSRLAILGSRQCAFRLLPPDSQRRSRTARQRVSTLSSEIFFRLPIIDKK